MRPLVLVGALFVGLASVASADQSVVHFSGHSWETGGFPPSDPGDQFSALGIVNDIEAPLFWSPDIFSYTWYMRDLLSTGETQSGTTRIVVYDGGEMTIYVDSVPSNHDYGINPPNATAPSTFTDGHAIYLGGGFTSFTLTYNSATSSGTFVGEIVFSEGNAYPQLQSDDGYTIGADISDVSPEGYDLELNGNLFVDGPVPVDQKTWGNLKSLYR